MLRGCHALCPTPSGPQKAAARCVLSVCCEGGPPSVLHVKGEGGEPNTGPPSQLVRLEVRGQSFLLNQIRKMIGMVMICVAAEFSDQVGGAFGHRRRAKDWVPICLGNRSDGGHSCACVAVAGPLSDRVPCARLARTGPPEGPGFPLEDRDVPYSTSFHVKIAICETKLRQIRQVSGPTTRI